jgi:hypothetical protein
MVDKNELLYPMPETRPVRDRPTEFLTSVDMLLSKLWGVKDFRRYLDALTNQSAIEGKFELDRSMAALRIRNEARENKITDVANATLARIMRAIETLLRRDNLGKKKRIAKARTQAAE